jgi:branched-chain amino acid transport system ATP-binding protein
MIMLELKDLILTYAGVIALKGVSLTVQEGETVALIGSNGSGKSSTLRAISGLKAPASGEIWFQGQRIDGLPPHKIVGLGIAHVPEGRRVFPYMTTFENLKMGAFLRNDKKQIQTDYEMIYRHFPRLQERSRQVGETLSGGEQQMLAIGRALMANPKLLLLDEPSLGLAPLMVQEIAGVISDIRQRIGVSIILVEQNARMALKLADRAYVIVTGRIAMEGAASDLMNKEEVKKAYLGM